jgi:signal transduction histidine kinase
MGNHTNGVAQLLEQRTRELQSCETRLRNLITRNADGIIIVDNKGIVRFVNPAAEALFNHRAANLLGSLFGFPLVAGETTELDVLRAGGEAAVAEMRVVETEWEGQPAFLASLRDITDRKRAEEARAHLIREQAARAQAEEASRLKDEFLAMLAHELRNPLAPIRNAVQLLRKLAPAEPQYQRAKDVIDRQVQHLARLVDDLLDTARITQGKITLRKERLKLVDIIERALEASRIFIDSRNHELYLTLPEEPLWLEGDPVRLVQIITNLLNNAAKYTERGGHIWLTVEAAGTEAVLRVRDNGVGIPANLLPRVFDLFSQAERSLDRSTAGLGIGLALVRTLVELHGGRVEACSDGAGQGSEFIVCLPALAEAPLEAECPSGATVKSTATPRARYRVLVVDDNVDSAGCLALLLKLSGHDVQMAHDGPTALDLARMFHPQIVLLDIGLPQINGYEVARRLREWPEIQKSVLIALTGYGRAEDQQLSKEAGFDYHLVKPADPDALEALINALELS